MRKLIIITTLAALAAMTAGADVLRLKDGTQVDGTYIGGDSREVKFLRANGSVKSYAVGDIAGLDFGEAAAQAEESLAVSAPQPTAAAASGGVLIPEGTEISVRMIDSIDSDINGVGERFRASLESPIIVDGREVAPRGADAFVQVAKVDQAGRISGKEEVAVELSALMIDGREYTVNSDFAEVSSKSKTSKTAKTAAGGAAIGAIIGAIAGGGKGAAIGAGAGAGAGTVYSATRGTKVRIPSETLLTFNLRQPVTK